MRLFEKGFCCLRPILLVGMVSAGGHSFLLVAVVSIHFCWSSERQELLEHELKQNIDAEQVYLDSLVALNLTTEEWIGLVDQVRANSTLSAKVLGADVSEDTFSVRMVELMNRQRKAIADMKAKAKRENPITPAQQKEFMPTFVKNQSSAIYTTCWT
nr:hypothetical protein [Tanacetum cinerariifolium]